MYRSLPDILRALRGVSYNKKPLHTLRGRVWLCYALYLSGLSLPEFAARYLRRGRTRSNIQKKWESGQVTPKEQSVAAVEALLPGTRWVFDLPLWELLTNAPISSRRLNAMVKRFTGACGGFRMWRFPEDEELIERQLIPIALYPDTDRLVARNDIWGLIGCILQTRLCEQDRSEGEHEEISKNMFRALPGALKYTWLRPFADELLSALHTLQARVLFSAIWYDVDDQIILRQADDPNHEPWRELQERDPQTHRFVGVDDPILPASIISGSEVRRRAQKAAARRAARKARRIAGSPTPGS